MTFVHDEKVEVAGEHDVSFGLPTGAEPASFVRAKPVLAKPMAGSDRSGAGSGTPTHSLKPNPRPARQLLARQHIRTVFEEVCETVYEVRDFETLLLMLKHIVRALNYLRLAGYVHRDVSCGNCLWDIDGKQGKISDLEYARKFDELSGHDPRTGTPSFMAAEYQDREHYFAPVAKASQGFDKFSATLRRTKVRKSFKFFTFNFYHDVESVFWIFI
ncbi:hypothetical protein DXG03_004563, partial [Asterophora parasitica]